MAGAGDLAKYYQDLGAVIGAPHRYRASADPGGRMFLRHMYTASPLVMIRPGRARFTESAKLEEAFKGILGADEAAKLKNVDDGTGSGLYKEDGRFGTGSDKRFLGQLASDARAKKQGTVASAKQLESNLRYFEFEQHVGEYLSTVMTLSSRIFSRLSKNSTLPWGELNASSPENTMGGFFTFWADNSTSVSETASSEYGASVVAEILRKIKDMNTEATFLFGETGAGNAIGGAVEGAVDMAGGQGGEASMGSSLGSAIRGYVPLLPNVWKGSSFQRSYSLSFKFYSPYGHPEAIYRNVLLPFSMIMALALPMMRRPSSFSEPFLFQMDVPGYFACDLGLCTGLSFVKGGSEGLWTVDGLPRQIDVTMAVEDLYPTLMASGTVGSLATNIGLMTFLDNLAGINLAVSGLRTDLIADLKSKMFGISSKPVSIAGGIRANFEDFMNGKITGVFR